MLCARLRERVIPAEAGVEVASTGRLFEHLFEQSKGTPRRRPSVNAWPQISRTRSHDPARHPSASSASLAGMPDEHPSIARFRAELATRGGTGEIVVLPDSVHTAALAAEALGCEVGAIANSLLFDSGGTPVLILTSGAHRVDTAKVAATTGPLERADKDFVRQHTGQVIGGVSPIAHPAPVPTYIDPWLKTYDVVWAAAGHPAAVFSTTYDELVTMTGATEIEVA